jgi:hypothetical protein
MGPQGPVGPQGPKGDKGDKGDPGGYWSESGSDIYYNSGNVGIGTTSPTQNLHVEGNVRFTGSIFDSNNEEGTIGQVLQTTGSGIDWVDITLISDNDWIVSDIDMYSAVSGNVGIGTMSPSSKLEVVGTITGDGLVIDGTVSGSGFNGWDKDDTDDLTTGTAFAGDVSGPYYNLQLGAGVVGPYTIANGAVTQAKLSFDTATQNELDAHKSTPSAHHAKTTSASELTSGILDDAVLSSNVPLKDTANTFSESQTINGGLRVSVDVGIGTTSPSSRLEVVGTITSDGLNIDGPVLGPGFNGWDKDETNDLTTGTAFAGDVSGPYNNLQLGAGAVRTNNINIGAVTQAKLSFDTATQNELNAHENTPSAHHTKTTSAYELTSGTLNDARLSSNVPLKDSANTFSAPQTITSDLRVTGNVGLGVNPSQKLDVDGNVRITGSIIDNNNEAGTNGQLLQSTGTGIDWIDPTTIIDNYWTINSNDMYSAVSGNIGIGTINPTQKLDVNGNVRISGRIFDSYNQGGRSGQVLQSTGSGIYWGNPLPDDDWEVWGSNMHSAVVGNVGIGTSNPTNKLSVSGNADFTGNLGIGTSSPSAKLDVEVAWGSGGAATIGSSGNSATGNYAIALGYYTDASGGDSIAMGYYTDAYGSHSTAMGAFTNASGNSATAIGAFTDAYGDDSTAMGAFTNASGDTSTAMGYHTDAYGRYSTATGWYTNASGAISTAMGANIIAEADYSFGIGLAYDSTPPKITQPHTMAIMNGDVGIGTVNPENTLHVNGAINLDPIYPPASPSTGFVIYVDQWDGNLKAKSDTGIITTLAYD